MATLTILYDAECGLCQASKRTLEAIDATRQLAFMPLQEDWVQQEYPHLEADALRLWMHGICADGRIVKGAATYREIGRVISTKSTLGKVFRLYSVFARIPGVLTLSNGVYFIIAKNRYRLPFKPDPCDTGACAIDFTNRTLKP